MPRFPRAYRRQLEAQDSAKVDRIVRESSSEDVGYAAGATSRGDALRLRGLPAVGRGTSGAIRGTRPGENLWRS